MMRFCEVILCLLVNCFIIKRNGKMIYFYFTKHVKSRRTKIILKKVLF